MARSSITIHDQSEIRQAMSTEQDAPVKPQEDKEESAHGLAFWLVFLAVCEACFLSAFEAVRIAYLDPK